MARLALCLALFVVSAIGKDILISEDSWLVDEIPEVKDIPYDIPEEENAEIIPTNGNCNCNIHSS